jgi:hypothetical protein
MSDWRTGRPTVMRVRRRVPGELEQREPGVERLECGCCGMLRPVHEVTHVCRDLNGWACEDCGPLLFDAEVELRAVPGVRPPAAEDFHQWKEGA